MAVHTLVAAMLWEQLQLLPSMWPRPCVQPGPLPPAFLCSVPLLEGNNRHYASLGP